jgi:hypothetical protein
MGQCTEHEQQRVKNGSQSNENVFHQLYVRESLELIYHNRRLPLKSGQNMQDKNTEQFVPVFEPV